MKKYVMLLLLLSLSLGMSSCSQSKDKSMTDADKKALSGNVNTTDESGWSFDGEHKPSKEKSNTSEEKSKEGKAGKNLDADTINTTNGSGSSVK